MKQFDVEVEGQFSVSLNCDDPALSAEKVEKTLNQYLQGQWTVRSCMEKAVSDA